MSWVHVNIKNTTITTPATSAETPPVYRYETSAEVILTSGIPEELFVYDVSDDEFAHVATVFDLNTYPTNKADAVADSLLFYRVKKMSKSYDSKSIAVLAAEHTQLRLQRVNKDWQAQEPGTFDSDVQLTYDSGDE